MTTASARIFTSGTFAREVGISVETVRRLEQRGILAPIRDLTNRRLFSETDLAKYRDYVAMMAAR